MLRVGLMLDSRISGAWVAKVIGDIQSSDFARVELAIFNSLWSQGNTKPRGSWNSGVFRLYEKWDYRRNKQADDALESTDVTPLLKGVPSIHVQPQPSGPRDRISDSDTVQISEKELDVIFRFGFRPLDGDILTSARYGVWAFSHSGMGDDAEPTLFREILHRSPVSESTLQIEAGATHHVIYRGQASTDGTSLYRNRNSVFWKSPEFALRCLRDLNENGIEYLLSHPTYSGPVPSENHAVGAPGNFRMAAFMFGRFARGLQARIAARRPENIVKWYLAVRQRNKTRSFDDPAGYRLVQSPSDRFHADPFLFVKDGKTYLFVEDFRYVDDRAVISYCEVAPDGTFDLPVEVLRRPYHLSYPFLIEDEGEIYMMPETRGNRTLELYRATHFPTDWEFAATLFDDAYMADATIQKIGGKFWMFATVSNGKYSNCDELCLFFSDAVKGPWTPHPCNPLISDVRRARPAGNLFYDGNRLIRPSQDCGKAYGYALVFSEVLTLTETEYEERPAGRLAPSIAEGHEGTHTYNQTEQLEIIDRKLAPKYAIMTRNV
jgi:hypothetical protein